MVWLGEWFNPPRERDAAIRAAMENYVRVLEKHVRAAPHNWFNFFDFWQKK